MIVCTNKMNTHRERLTEYTRPYSCHYVSHLFETPHSFDATNANIGDFGQTIESDMNVQEHLRNVMP